MEKNKPTILVADDMPSNVRSVCSILSDQYSMVFALNGQEALQQANKHHPDLILLDIEMPEMDGYEACRRLKAQSETSSTPVLFLTAKDQIEHVIQGFEVGAVDYIQKPFEPAVLKARVNSQLRSAYYQKMKERERLLEEMHDGFGSQLMSARLMMINGEISQDGLVQLMGECIDDLHLVVDLFGNQMPTLEEALAQYRYRIKNRVANLPVQLHWNLQLERCHPLSEHVILQLLRIVQEALNNSLKHADAKHIQITAHCSGEQLQISVMDDGAGLPDELKRNRGIGNMEKRATSIGGEIDIRNGNPGVVVEVVL